MKISEEIWAVMPTRGGSKGLPEKNTRITAGKPLLHHMLEAAVATSSLSRVFLTTDSDATAETASKIDKVEIRRHNSLLSAAGRPSFGVFKSAIEKIIREHAIMPRMVVMLRATAPLCMPVDIDSSIKLLLKNKSWATSVLSVVKSDVTPKRIYTLDKKGFLRSRERTPEKHYPLPRQTFDSVYIRNGAIYATFPNVVRRDSLWGKRPLAYVMPKERSVNINDEVDFILAEALLERKKFEV